MISADSKEDLEIKKMQVRTYLDALGMRGISLMSISLFNIFCKVLNSIGICFMETFTPLILVMSDKYPRGISLMFEQEKVLQSIIPIFPKQDIENRIGTPIRY